MVSKWESLISEKKTRQYVRFCVKPANPLIDCTQLIISNVSNIFSGRNAHVIGHNALNLSFQKRKVGSLTVLDLK